MTALESSPGTSPELVVVGSSAGGVGALSVFVNTLHKDFRAPVVLAQHLDPQRPSNLGSILERRSTLPIVVVGDTSPTQLEGGKVYVVPSNRHVKIIDGHLQLEADHKDRPKPSVDLLLSSAAEAYGEHLIAVVLTGSGSDGAAGAVDVKNNGGVVIIQNPQTAPYPSMPLSLPPTVVDHVVEIEQIGPLLHDLLDGVQLPSAERVEDPLRDLLSVVSQETSIDFRNYKSSTILRRIARRMAITHNGNIRDYTDFVRTHPDEIKELVRAFLIKVTGFFRDPEAFEVIRNAILPVLIEQGRENGRVLRIWSAGCATGEEAYSLALLVADHLGSDFPEWSVRVFATDLADDAIGFARRGVYPENVLKDLPDNYRDQYFERIDHGFRISKMLRQSVIFGQQDISRGVPFPRIDLVACRNLLIYLKPELQQTVLDLFAYSLHQSRGFLFLGKAETARPTKVSFELVNKRWKIYRCLGGPLAFPLHDAATQTGLQYNKRENRPRQITSPSTPRIHDMTDGETEVSQMRRINETMLRYTTAGVVIIDRSYRIVTVNAVARRLLGIRDLAYNQDFLHTVRGIPYQDVRMAIDITFREHSTSTIAELELDPTAVGSGRYVNFTVMKMQTEPGAHELAVISVIDTTDQVQLKKRLEAVQHEQSQLVGELSAANKRLSDMNQELQDANEELQAANEELMLTQEELQATNEEFEATNEELQATNEELETNNEELQATNEELQTTNDELGARSLELSEMTRLSRDGELQFTTEMLERFPYYVIVLNATDLTIKATTPDYLNGGATHLRGQPLVEAFESDQLELLIGLLGEAVKTREAVSTKPISLLVIEAGIAESGSAHIVTTIFPMMDSTGNVSQLLLFGEKSPAKVSLRETS